MGIPIFVESFFLRTQHFKQFKKVFYQIGLLRVRMKGIPCNGNLVK